LFNLYQALKMYDHLCEVVDEYDTEILRYIKSLQPTIDLNEPVPPAVTKAKANSIKKKGQEPMRQALFQLTGLDMTRIDGIGVDTATKVISELGVDFSMFPSEAHFISYLRLAPNLSISAGKRVVSRSVATTCTHVAAALRTAAVTLKNSKTALGAFYRKVSRRKGASVAVFATARKLAQIIYRMVKYGHGYVDIGAEAYEARFNNRRFEFFSKALNEMGYKVEPLTGSEEVAA
jgi:transposase